MEIPTPPSLAEFDLTELIMTQLPERAFANKQRYFILGGIALVVCAVSLIGHSLYLGLVCALYTIPLGYWIGNIVFIKLERLERVLN